MTSNRDIALYFVLAFLVSAGLGLVIFPLVDWAYTLGNVIRMTIATVCVHILHHGWKTKRSST